MHSDNALLRLLPPNTNGKSLSILSAEPCGRDFAVKVMQDGKIFRSQASKFLNYVDEATGEILGDPVNYLRKLWATEICRRNGGTWPLDILIWGLQIDGVGNATAETIARHLKTWDNFLLALKQLQEIDVPSSRNEIITAVGEEYWRVGKLDQFNPAKVLDVYPKPLSILMREGVSGPKTWAKLRAWIDSSSAKETMARLFEFGRASSLRDAPLAAEVIAFSGSFESVSRDEAQKIAEKLGARVVGLPSPDTTILVTGAGSSPSKLKKAQRFGIKILSEADWLDFVKISGKEK